MPLTSRSFDRNRFVRAVNASGLTKSELGNIFEVSRQQIYNLCEDATPRNAATLRRTNLYAGAICQLIDQRVLPFPKSIEPDKRKVLITKLVKRLYEIARP